MAGLLDDLGGYSPEQSWRARWRMPRGGLLDTLPDDEPMPRYAEPSGLLSYIRPVADAAGQAVGVLDHYTLGIPSAAAGLVNAAIPDFIKDLIPGRPLGDLMKAKEVARDATDAFAARGRGARDLLSLPDAFAGSVPGGVNHLAARDVRKIPKQDIDLASSLREHAAINGSAADYLSNNGHTGYIYAADIPKPTVHVADGHPYYNMPQSKALEILGSEGHKSVRYIPKDMQETLKTPQGAEAAVKAGVPGVRVPGGKWGDSFVVFDDGLLNIENRQQAMPSPAGIRAYHGSPHDFDKFSLDKIGTGEGAQAYGHGLYFAENEGVAKSYKESLKANDAPASTARWAMQEANGDAAAAIDKVRGSMAWKEANGGLSEADRAKHLDAIKRLENGSFDGRMYEVRINADPEHFLDWDKPLSQQSEKVRGAVRSLGAEKYTVRGADGYDVRAPGSDGRMTTTFSEAEARRIAGEVSADRGEQVVKALGISSKPGQMEQKLRDAGIPGIKYLDQGSRDVPLEFASKAEAEAAGYRNGGHDIAPGRYAPYDAGGMYVSDPKGTRNYVVFDDKLIDILKKYGIAGTMVAGGGMAVSSSDVEAHPALIPLLMGTAGLMAGGLSNDADRAELMLNRQSPRLYDYAPKPGMLDLMGPR